LEEAELIKVWRAGRVNFFIINHKSEIIDMYISFHLIGKEKKRNKKKKKA